MTLTSTNKEELEQQLLQLVEMTADISREEGLRSGGRGGSEASAGLESGQLPGAIGSVVNEVSAAFAGVLQDNERLAEELLVYYDQLNTAFQAVRGVARCKSTSEAVEVLADEVGRAINSWYSYYVGPLTSVGSAGSAAAGQEGGMICRVAKEAQSESAEEYFGRHEESLHSLINSEVDSQVAMIEYQGPYDLDHEGRGNVLTVRLSTLDEATGAGGGLIFVRGDHQDPFAAVDMNLATALVGMGSAVINNILYAQKLTRTYLQVITALVRTIEAKDAYTSGHSTRVAELAHALGKHVGLGEKELQLLEWAGLMHDIGKIGISDKILYKPGKLTDDEFAEIKWHPVKSFNVLEPIEALHAALPAVKHHHEHYDGSGYPDGLTGEAIPFSARMLQVADVWDALTSTRSYRESMPVEKALGIMRAEAGTTMDPQLVASFEEMLRAQGVFGEDGQDDGAGRATS